MDTIQFDYIISETDFIEFNKWFMNEKKKGKRVKIYLYIMVPIFIGLSILTFLKPSPDLILLTMIVFSSVFLLLFLPLLLNLSVKKIYRTNKQIQLENHYLIDQSGFFLKTEQMEVHYNWEDILEITQSKRFYFVFITPTQAIFIPKWIIIEQGDLKAFKTLFTEKCPQSKWKSLLK